MHLLRTRAQEAAMKYFVLGAFSSAFFLYGVALVYGATGSTNLAQIRSFLDANVLAEQYILLTGVALLLVGLAFKVAAVPFHMWAPDVYHGSPSPISGYMASAAKAAGFAAMLRVFYVAFQTYAVDWTPLVGVLAAITLVVGSLLAIVQTNVKRMMAYSSISHAGYVLVAVQSASAEGTQAALFYLVTYAVTVIGTFGVIMIAGGLGENSQSLASYRGLAQRRPVLALAFTFLLLSQAGVPLTSGFVAKFVVIQSAVAVEDYALAVLAMLTSVVSAFMYLRIVITMYVGESDEPAPSVRVPWPAGATLVAVVGFTLLVGLLPQFLLEFASDSVPVLPLVT
jgi:NADH-quinone oxidoreductase subunit N